MVTLRMTLALALVSALYGVWELFAEKRGSLELGMKFARRKRYALEEPLLPSTARQGASIRVV